MLNEINLALENQGLQSAYRDRRIEQTIINKEKESKNIFFPEYFKSFPGISGNTTTYSPEIRSNSSISISQEEEINDFPIFYKQIEKISKKLNLEKNIQEIISKLISKYLTTNSEKDLNISYTSQNEFLIYKKDDSGIKNLLISEEGDIEILYLKSNVQDSKNKLFFNDNGLDLNSIINEFNAFN